MNIISKIRKWQNLLSTPLHTVLSSSIFHPLSPFHSLTCILHFTFPLYLFLSVSLSVSVSVSLSLNLSVFPFIFLTHSLYRLLHFPPMCCTINQQMFWFGHHSSSHPIFLSLSLSFSVCSDFISTLLLRT